MNPFGLKIYANYYKLTREISEAFAPPGESAATGEWMDGHWLPQLSKLSSSEPPPMSNFHLHIAQYVFANCKAKACAHCPPSSHAQMTALKLSTLAVMPASRIL